MILCSGSVNVFGSDSKANSKMQYFPVENVRLTDGDFKKAQDMDIDYILTLDPDRLLAPYRKEAGLSPKAENYTNWENTGLDGHIGGHYLSALSYMYAATGNPEIGNRLIYFLNELKLCQDASGNGYLSGIPGGKTMWAEIAEGKIDAASFSLNGRWVPLYNIHKIYAGLKDAYIQTHNIMAKDMLIALSDWMLLEVSALSDEQIQQMLASEHGGLNEIFADVYDITGDDKYLDLAVKFSDKSILNPLIAKRNELTGKHANTQIPKVIGYKRIADIKNDSSWEEGVEYFWNDVVSNRSVSIGGNSVREHFHSPDDFSSMLESEQGPETCNTYNMLRLTKLLNESAPESKYADYIERAIFNHILSTQNPEHGGFVYFTPMRPGHYRVYSQPQTSFWCCVGSGLENHARYGEYIYSHNDDEIFVNLYIPSVLTWGDGNKLEQVTDFPNNNSVSLIVSPADKSKFKIGIRVPYWTDGEGIKVMVNEKPQKYSLVDGYIKIDRNWKKNDRITVTFPMSVHVEQLADKSSNYSFLYGPVVLAADLGKDQQTGMFADDSRGGHIATGKKLPLEEMPYIVGSEDELLSLIERNYDSPISFSIKSVMPEKYANLKLVPFNSLNECRYIVYWPVISEEQSERRLRDLAEAQAEKTRLDAITIDKVICGEQQPESDHFVEFSESNTGSTEDRHWRNASKDGWFSYKMKTGDRDAKVIRVYYKPSFNRNGKLFVENKEIGVINTSSDGPLSFVDYEIGDSDSQIVNKTVQSVVVKIEGNGNMTPDIYEIRLLK